MTPHRIDWYHLALLVLVALSAALVVALAWTLAVATGLAEWLS